MLGEYRRYLEGPISGQRHQPHRTTRFLADVSLKTAALETLSGFVNASQARAAVEERDLGVVRGLQNRRVSDKAHRGAITVDALSGAGGRSHPQETNL
jgi:hypothetical protein